MTKEKVNLNLATDRIRHLLQKHSEAGYEDVEKLFGKMTRSVRVTFYRIHKEMFGDSGSLKRPYAKPAPKRNKVVSYFKKYPDHTLDDAAKALHYRRDRIYALLYDAIQRGEAVTFQKKTPGTADTCLSAAIREYFVKHPDATSKECAGVTGSSVSYVSLVRYRDRMKAT